MNIEFAKYNTFFKTGATQKVVHHLYDLVLVHVTVIHPAVAVTPAWGWSCDFRPWGGWTKSSQPAPIGCGQPGVPTHDEAVKSTFAD